MKLHNLFFYFLFVVMFVLMIGSNINKSVTWDEPLYFVSGLYYLKDGQTFNSLQPILSSVISAFPLLFLNVELLPYSEINHIYNDARGKFLYYGSNNLDLITFWSRIGSILFSLVLAYYVYKWAKELYGEKAGLFALFLYTFCITILAWSVSANPDLLSAGLGFISFYYFWKYLNNNENKYLLICALLFGLSISAKITGLFMIFIFILAYILFNSNISFNNFKKLGKVFFTFVILSFVVLTVVHVRDMRPFYDTNDVFYQATTSKEYRSEQRLEKILDQYFDSESKVRGVVKFSVTEMPVPGRNFLQALYSHMQGGGYKGRTTFLFGEWSIDQGTISYYFILLLLKLPIAILSFILLSFIFFRKCRNHNLKNEFYLLIPIILWLFMFIFVSKINSGIRHLIFILPFLFVFSSKIVNLKFKWRKTWTFVLYGLGIWLIIANLTTYPFYVSYFNEFVGKDGYRYLGSDNIDIGQDMKHIQKYMEINNIDRIKLHYHGLEKPEYRNINYELIDCTPTKGLIVISAAVLQGASYNGNYREDGPDLTCYSWLYEHEPIDLIGGSILVYDIK